MRSFELILGVVVIVVQSVNYRPVSFSETYFWETQNLINHPDFSKNKISIREKCSNRFYAYIL